MCVKKLIEKFEVSRPAFACVVSDTARLSIDAINQKDVYALEIFTHWYGWQVLRMGEEQQGQFLAILKDLIVKTDRRITGREGPYKNEIEASRPAWCVAWEGSWVGGSGLVWSEFCVLSNGLTGAPAGLQRTEP
eukprot:1830744-Rhodomonas_salina.1